MQFSKRFALLLILLISLFTAFGLVLKRGVSIETNILKLMPKSTASELSGTVDAFSDSQTGEMVFLLTHRSEDSLAALAASMEQDLEESGLFHSITGAIDEEAQKEWYTTYFPHRYSFLPDGVKRILDSPKASKRLYRYLQRKLYTIVPDYYGAALEHDPFQLFPTFMQNLFGESSGELHNNYALIPSEEHGFGTILTGSVKGSPFAPDVQDSVEALVMNWKEKSSAAGGELHSTGILRFAAQAFKEAKSEITFIGLVSLIGVIVILLLTFRSPKLVIVGTVPILVGILTGFTVTAAAFRAFHVIALTMGASLTGIAIDYSLHYLTHLRFSPGEHHSVLKQVLPGITLGAVTTLIGYGVLGFGGFPGFQQIALFTGAGLIGSYVTVVLGFPQLLQHNDKRPLSGDVILQKFFSLKRLFIALPLLLVIAVLIGSFKVRANDDIFSMRAPMPELDAEEKVIRGFSEGIEGSRFVVVTAHDNESLIANLKVASAKLDSLVKDSALAGYMSLSNFIETESESKAYQAKLLSALQADSAFLLNQMKELGFADSVVTSLLNDVEQAQPLSLESWMESPVSGPWRRLYIPEGDSCASIIMLKTVYSEEAMESADFGSNGFYLNKVAEVSRTLGTYRKEATILTLVAYLVIWILLIVRYKFKKGTVIFLPPVIAGAASLMIPGLFGGSITFMHIMALLLVLGIGIDYTIFFAEGGSHQKETLLAVTLSALSTILAFGVLGLSSTPALQAIGMVITPGILFSLLMAPLAISSKEKS